MGAVRWVDDALVPLPRLVGYIPFVVSDDGARIGVEGAKRFVVGSGNVVPLSLRNPPAGADALAYASGDGMLVSDRYGTIWDRGGRYRRLSSDLSDFKLIPVSNTLQQ